VINRVEKVLKKFAIGKLTKEDSGLVASEPRKN
jgi:hypothetical protein